MDFHENFYIKLGAKVAIAQKALSLNDVKAI